MFRGRKAASLPTCASRGPRHSPGARTAVDGLRAEEDQPAGRPPLPVATQTGSSLQGKPVASTSITASGSTRASRRGSSRPSSACEPPVRSEPAPAGGRRAAKGILREQGQEAFRLGPQSCGSKPAGVLAGLPGEHDLPTHQPSSRLHSPGGVANPSRIDSRISLRRWFSCVRRSGVGFAWQTL